LNRAELVAYYKASEVMLITPLKDGMNLVAKEYIASNTEENGVLILSEYAGAASQLFREALLVNPYDTKGVAETIFAALTMTTRERKKRMRKMRRNVQRYNIFWWVRTFLHAAISKELNDFPLIKEYIPADDVVETEKV
jgi:trehalose 6-phosphate synthase